MEKFPKKNLEASKKDSSPFPVDRISWTDEDFERHHRAMKSLPCIRGHEAFREVIGALSQLVEYHEDEGAPFWKYSVQTFEPRQVILRYGGEDWSYAFHQQFKYGERTREQESSVTGIAKKIVKEVSKLVRSYKRQIDAAEPQERAPLENELVAKVEDIFAALYHPDVRAGNVGVEKIQGPRGPVYMTHDGNHRLAAARLIDLKRVRGIVKEPQKDSLGSDFWYELLAILPPKQSRELEDLYNDLYPADEAGLKKDREQLEKAKARLPKIHSVLEKKKNERMAEAKKRGEERDKAEKEIKKKYSLVDRAYSSLEGMTGFQETLYKEGLEYIWNHPSFSKYRKKYKKEISAIGLILSSDGGGDFHLFGMDLDIYPQRTEDEIKFRAIQAYIKEHPELRSLIQSRSQSGL